MGWAGAGPVARRDCALPLLSPLADTRAGAAERRRAAAARGRVARGPALSIGLAIALVALTSLTVAGLLLPLLLRRGGAASRDAYNLAVYRDQLAEVERD